MSTCPGPLLCLLLVGVPHLAQAQEVAPEDTVAPKPSADTVPPPPVRYFTFGYDYGTQALYNPLWVLINRSFDVLQDRLVSRDIFSLEYRNNATNVLSNLAHPFTAIADGGWKTFVTEEILPLSYTQDTARWIPNYSLHLLGGGMTYAALGEWFEDHQVPLPRLWAAATVMAAAFMNETLENHGVKGTNTDAIADMYFFDLGGILLFSFDGTKRFFSHTVVLSDWSLQPALTFPHGHLHNVGNYFAAKWALPFYPRLRLFSWFGEATTLGLSFALDEEYSISAVAGGAAIHLVNRSTHQLQNTVDFTPTAAIFLDRRESLLASLQVTDTVDYFVHANLYPHALWSRGPSLGLWTVVDRQGRVAAGISVARLLGMGVGWSGF